MDNYGKNKKKFVFYITDDIHARFLLKMQELHLKKTSLIRDFIEAVINDNSNIVAWLEGDLSSKISKRSLAIRKRENKKAALQSAKFNLDNKDVSEIFDILAENENE